MRSLGIERHWIPIPALEDTECEQENFDPVAQNRGDTFSSIVSIS